MPRLQQASSTPASTPTSTLKIKIIDVPGSQADIMADHFMELGAMSAGYVL